MFEIFQIPGFGDSSLVGLLIFWIPFIIIMLYGQRLQMYLSLGEISKSLNKLKVMKEKSREEAIDFIGKISKSKENLNDKIDQFLEYFAIQPVDLDPAGLVKKIEHIINIRDERIRNEIKELVSTATDVETSNIENVIEVATVLNFVYKVVRHYYLLGKKTMSYLWVVQLQMILPTIMQEADALMSAISAFKQSQPIGDGIGPMIVGKMMIGKDKKTIAKDTILSELDYKGRTLYLIKATGPGGNVGQPGEGIIRLIDNMGTKIDAIIMIDAALKLEGEKTGEIAEGIGAAIGGIGVERYKIEEIASKNKIPLYAIVIKQSILDAISTMKKEIAETTDKVIEKVNHIVENKTNEGNKLIVVGVGNTVGVS